MRWAKWLLLGMLLAGFASQSSAQAVGSANKAEAIAKGAGRVAVNGGGELEYRVIGTGEAVLLIHGAVFAAAFDPLLTEAGLSKYKVITYHRRGYAGSTRANAPFTIAQQAADAVALLDRLGVPRAHLVGHSYGGAIALQLATTYPDRVASLSLLEASFMPPTPAAQELFGHLTAATAIYNAGDARGAIARFTAGVAGPNTFEAMPPAMQNQAVADAATFFTVEVPAAQLWVFNNADLAKLPFPMLAVVGANTNPAFRDGHNLVRQTVPSAEELVVTGAGHELQMSQPRFVAEGIAAFLRKHPIR